MSQDNMQQVQKRLNQYWYVDGITEIGFGFLCLTLGFYFYIIEHLDESSLLFKLLPIGFVLVILGSAFGINRFVSYLKNRITYPRTGFVAYRQVRSYWRFLIGALVGLMSAALSIMISRLPVSIDWMPLITGVMFTLVSLYIAYRIGLWRYVIIAILTFILGIYLSLEAGGNYAGLFTFYLVLGSALSAIGIIILGRYVISNQPPTEELE